MEPILTGLLGARAAPRLERYARIVVVAVLVAIAVNEVYFAVRDWPLHDMDIYLAAGQRLREGQILYPLGGPFYASFWYSPWFAVLWIPLTYLPRLAVAIAWSAVLLVATALVTWLVGRSGRSGPLLALLVGPALFAVSAGGNVQAPMLLVLIWGLQRRSGPLWVGIAASLKYTPILLALVYVARREWLRAAAAVAIAAALIVPGFVLGLGQAAVKSQANEAMSLLGFSLPAYLTVVIAFCMLAVAGPRRFSALASAAASVLALPRLFAYDVTLMAAGVSSSPGPESRPQREQ